jgi:hypothetical protein
MDRKSSEDGDTRKTSPVVAALTIQFQFLFRASAVLLRHSLQLTQTIVPTVLIAITLQIDLFQSSPRRCSHPVPTISHSSPPIGNAALADSA